MTEQKETGAAVGGRNAGEAEAAGSSLADGRAPSKFYTYGAKIAGGFTRVPNGLLSDPNLSPAAKVVWCSLAQHEWGRGTGCYPSIARLVERTGLSKRWVIRKLQELEAAGYLVAKRRHGTFSLYELRYKDDEDSTTAKPVHYSSPVEAEPVHSDARGGELSCTTPVHSSAPDVDLRSRRPEEEQTNGCVSVELSGRQEQRQPLPVKVKGTTEHHELAKQLLDTLNAAADTPWLPNAVNLKPILNRLAEGHDEATLRAVILFKSDEWCASPMARQLKPGVLFGDKFTMYAGESEHLVEPLRDELEADAEVERLRQLGLRRKDEGADEAELAELRARYWESEQRLRRAQVATERLLGDSACALSNVYAGNSLVDEVLGGNGNGG